MTKYHFRRMFLGIATAPLFLGLYTLLFVLLDMAAGQGPMASLAVIAQNYWAVGIGYVVFLTMTTPRD